MNTVHVNYRRNKDRWEVSYFEGYRVVFRDFVYGSEKPSPKGIHAWLAAKGVKKPYKITWFN